MLNYSLHRLFYVCAILKKRGDDVKGKKEGKKDFQQTYMTTKKEGPAHLNQTLFIMAF